MNPLAALSTFVIPAAPTARDATPGLTSMARGSHDVAKANGPDAHRLEQAAREFEAVFLRQMLSSLERTTRVSSKGNAQAGQQTYGSMIVDSVADAVAKAGGLGVAEMLTNSLADRAHLVSPAKTAVSTHTEPGTTPGPAPAEAEPTKWPLSFSEDTRISPQGSTRVAVPQSEIRASAAPIKGPLADRRIP
jgi:Rod binding domain-containing protein